MRHPVLDRVFADLYLGDAIDDEAWPRAGVVLRGIGPWPSDEVPHFYRRAVETMERGGSAKHVVMLVKFVCRPFDIAERTRALERAMRAAGDGPEAPSPPDRR